MLIYLYKIEEGKIKWKQLDKDALKQIVTDKYNTPNGDTVVAFGYYGENY